MAKRDPDARERLLTIATQSFYEKGYYGVRMQEIADKAGLNKAMLNYYFRNKEQLFDAVFEQALGVLLPSLQRFFSDQAPLQEKISRLIDEYTDLLQTHPHVPVFILSELRMHPQKLDALSQNAPFQTDLLLAQISKEVEAGKIRPVEPRTFVLHLFSCCIFPHVSGLLWQNYFKLDQDEYKELLQERKQDIMDMFWNNLQK